MSTKWKSMNTKASKKKIDNNGKIAKLAPRSSNWEAQQPLNPKP
jgi:hypothetical protein